MRIKVDVSLDVVAPEEKVLEDPVAGLFVEALQEGGTDGHHSLEVLRVDDVDGVVDSDGSSEGEREGMR